MAWKQPPQSVSFNRHNSQTIAEIFTDTIVAGDQAFIHMRPCITGNIVIMLFFFSVSFDDLFQVQPLWRSGWFPWYSQLFGKIQLFGLFSYFFGSIFDVLFVKLFGKVAAFRFPLLSFQTHGCFTFLALLLFLDQSLGFDSLFLFRWTPGYRWSLLPRVCLALRSFRSHLPGLSLPSAPPFQDLDLIKFAVDLFVKQPVKTSFLLYGKFFYWSHMIFDLFYRHHPNS